MGEEILEDIVIKFCSQAGMCDVDKCTQFGDDRLRALGEASGQTSASSTGFSGRP